MAIAERIDEHTLGPSDADLVERAIEGDRDALDVLYRRHVDAATRVGYVVAGNRHDAADAVAEAFSRVIAKIADGSINRQAPFRGYLLAATRNAALDQHRTTKRRRPTDDDVFIDLTDTAARPDERAVGATDAALVAAAFGDLPERWRSVLWLTEVEGMAPAEAADHLGVSANNAAQLATRARSRLRDRFLQAHLSTDDLPPRCAWTTERLGAYVGGGLSATETAKVTAHVAQCDDCTARRDELADVGGTLRRAMFPVPLGLGLSGVGVAGLGAGSAAGGSAASGSGPLGWFTNLPVWGQAAVGGMVALGVAAGAVLGTQMLDDGPDEVKVLDTAVERPEADEPADVPVTEDAPGLDGPAVAPSPRIDIGEPLVIERQDRQPVEIGDPLVIERDPDTDTDTDPGDGDDGGGGGDGGGGDDGGSATLASASASGAYGGHQMGVTASDGGRGARVDDTTVGDDPGTRDDDGLSVSTGGAPGDRDLDLI